MSATKIPTGAPRPTDLTTTPPENPNAATSTMSAGQAQSSAAALHAAAGTDGTDRLDGSPNQVAKQDVPEGPIHNKYALTQDQGGFIKGLLKAILKVIWAVGGDSDKVDGISRIENKDIQKLLPNLKPGDVILNGNNGGLSHAAMYVGDGEIIHSMATTKTMRGKGGAVWDAIKDVFGFGPKDSKTGVIREGFGEFLDRFERDTYVILRREELEPDQVQKGVAHLESLVGKPYDYDFSSGDDEYYCTELVLEYLDASLGQDNSTVFNTEHYDYGFFKTDAIAPTNILEHSSLTPIAARESAKLNFETQLGEAKLF